MARPTSSGRSVRRELEQAGGHEVQRHLLALRDVAQEAGLDWDTVGAALKREGRLHLETY